MSQALERLSARKSSHNGAFAALQAVRSLAGKAVDGVTLGTKAAGLTLEQLKIKRDAVPLQTSTDWYTYSVYNSQILALTKESAKKPERKSPRTPA